MAILNTLAVPTSSHTMARRPCIQSKPSGPNSVAGQSRAYLNTLGMQVGQRGTANVASLLSMLKQSLVELKW